MDVGWLAERWTIIRLLLIESVKMKEFSDLGYIHKVQGSLCVCLCLYLFVICSEMAEPIELKFSGVLLGGQMVLVRNINNQQHH